MRAKIQQMYNRNKRQLVMRNLNFSHDYLHELLMEKSQQWAGLIRLSLQGCKINDNNIKIILDIDWPELTQLQLGFNQLKLDGIKKFVQKPWPKLHKIILDTNQIGDDGFLILLQYMQNKLTDLSVYTCHLTQNGIRSIADCCVSNLKNLYISYNRIGNNGVKWLTKLNLPSLEELIMKICGVQAEGFKHMTKAKWPNLRKILMGYYIIEDHSRMQLTQWQNLHENLYRKVNQFQICETSSICYINFIILETFDLKINKRSIGVKNGEMEKEIMRILLERNVIIN